MAAAIDYLHDSQLRSPAFRVVIDRLHYEDDPVIVYRALQALSDVRLLTAAIRELLIINRHVWRHLLEEFAKTCLDPEESPTLRDLQPHLEKLERNQRSTSYLLQQGSFKGLDFSDTFYPDLQAPTVTFTNCNFSSSLLHYSNFHRAAFHGCTFSGCILIGSYLEAAILPNQAERLKQNVIDHTARYHGEGDRRDLSTPSFLREAEEGWYGHWIEQAETDGLKRKFQAVWHNPSDITKRVEASIILEGEHGPFIRTGSDNDGVYETIPRSRWLLLDEKRGVVLIGGTRTLQRRVPSAWWAIWWQQLGSRPTQVLPVIDAEERQRGR